DLDLRVLLDDAINHPEECARIEFGLRGLRINFRPRDAQAFLQILFVPDQHVYILDNAPDDGDGAMLAAGNLPELLTKVQIEGSHCARSFGGPHPLDNQLRRRLRERRKDAAAVEPAHTARKDFFPIEVTRLEPRRRLVRAVVKDYRRA